MPTQLLITAASESYGTSLLALLGSLTCNWPGHPPVLVYDIGLEPPTLAELARHNIPVRKVPEFCPHWRKHFTWKTWCWNDAPAEHVFYLDAGIVALRPMNEVFAAIAMQGYFAIPNFFRLEDEASDAACEGVGVPLEFRRGLPTLAGGIFGFDRSGRLQQHLAELLRLASIEKHIAATALQHRHDQALNSLLLHRDFAPVLVSDGQLYGASDSPQQVPGQKLWVHRRQLSAADAVHFAARITQAGASYAPAVPASARPKNRVGFFKTLAQQLKQKRRQLFGRKPKIYDGIR